MSDGQQAPLPGLGRTSEELSRPGATAAIEVTRNTALVTPSRPDYRYGNVLVLKDPPGPGRIRGLPDKYRAACAASALPPSPTIAWERGLTADATPEPLPVGFVLVEDDVLSFDATLPVPAGSTTFDLRPIDGDMWDLISDMAIPEDGFVLDGLRDWLLFERRKLVEAGLGTWWGAWDVDNTLLGSCGAFGRGQVVRLDQLLVAPGARRRGVGSWLVRAIALAYPARHVVMEPERGSWRSRMYQEVGFSPVSRTCTLVEV